MSDLPEVFNASQFENDTQRHLRERFDSLTERTLIDISLFDPTDPDEFCRIRCRTGEREHEAAEPQLTHLLVHRMLQDTGLEIPSNDIDPRIVVQRKYDNGTRRVIFLITRQDESMVPVFIRTHEDGVTPRAINLCSYDWTQKAVRDLRIWSDYLLKLSEKLNLGDEVLKRLTARDLFQLDATFNEIQGL